MISILTRVIILMIVCVLSSVGGSKCRYDSDCPNCGLCIDDAAFTQRKCFNPYPVNELGNNVCDFQDKWRDDVCKDYCKNGGECRTYFGSSGPSCSCDSRKLLSGQRCEIQWPRADINYYVSGFSVFFAQVKEKSKSLKGYTLFVIAALYESPDTLQFFLETSEGYVIRFNVATSCANFRGKQIYPYYPLCKSCPVFLPTCSYAYLALVQFPYKLAFGPEMITTSRNVIGYMANITLVAKAKNREIYRKTHPIIVNYEGLLMDYLQFIPVIKLQNCGKNMEERISYNRKSTITLNADVRHRWGDSVEATWAIWNVDKFRQEYINPNIFQINNGDSWTLQPLTLETGIYRIELKVNVITGITSAINYADCYIEVMKSTIVAVISGGWIRTVNANHQIHISGEHSYNPDDQKSNKTFKFSWSCSPQCEHLVRDYIITPDRLSIPKDKMEYQKTYRFTLEVSAEGMNSGSAFQEVYVSDEDMYVRCLMNCLEEVIPSDPLFIEVKLPNNEQVQNTFVWTVTSNNGSNIDTTGIICKHHKFSSYLLCVEPNTLDSGGIYYVRAKKAESSEGAASAALKLTVGKTSPFTCTVSPATGVQLKTSFSITCSHPGRNVSWTYEFFDRNSSDLDLQYSGRMLATSSLGALSDFKMFRGTIAVYLFDLYGVVSKWSREIELVPYHATSEDVDGLLAEIEYLIKRNEMELALRKMSLVSEVLSQAEDRNYIAKSMVKFICMIPYNNQHIMKVGLLTVKNFIMSLTKEDSYKFKPQMLKSLTRVIHDLSHWSDYVMSLSNIAVPSITDGMLEQMATATVEVIELVLVNRNRSFLNTSLEDLKPSDYDDALEASIHTEALINDISEVVSFRQGTGYTKTSISSTTNLYFTIAQSDYINLLNIKINYDEGLPLKVSEKLLKELIARSVEEQTVHLTEVRYNPFWIGRRDISTNLLSLDVYSKDSVDLKLSRLQYIKSSVDLFLEVVHSEMGSAELEVTQIDPISNDVGNIDKLLTVLRLDLVGRSKMFMSFSFADSSDIIKIYVSKTIRPDYELVNSFGTIVSSSNPIYDKTPEVGNSDQFVYIGILPGPDIPVNGTVNVTVHFYYHLCLTWLRHNWVSQYCKVGTTLNNSNIHCSCTHLSFFSAVFAVPPNEVNPFNDISLFLTVKDNWFIVAFIACLLLVFLFLGVWARCNDVKDEIRRRVLVLEDNFPDDKNYYLLAVFTGCRVNAGTNANVGVLIDGDVSSSHSHILKSKLRKVLQRNSEDWFMIKTPLPLGVVLQMHIWSDNSGSSPDWYCYKMVVYDLQTSTVYTFFVEQWLAFESDEFCEAVLFPATAEDMNNAKRIFIDNVLFGFRDADMCGSIIARLPRSRMNRLDRVAIFTCFVVITLLVSLAFYNVAFNNSGNEGVDDFGFSFDSTDILLSFQTFVISSALIFVISVTFSRAYMPRKEQREQSLGNPSFSYTRPSQKSPVMKTHAVENTVQMPPRSHDDHSCYQRLVRRISRAFHPLPMSPVALSQSSAKTEKNRPLYIAAWVMTVVLITFCVYFITLYGLKLGQEESKKWLASIVMVLVDEFLIMSPLKIVFIALILTITFVRFVQISNFNITVNDFSGDIHTKDNFYYSLLMKKRAHEMYKPLSTSKRDVLRRKHTVKKALYNLLDLSVVIAYIVIICLVTSDYSIQVQSNANFHVSQMVLLKHKPRQINLRDIYNRTLYYDYLSSTFVAALYEIKWYNDENLYPSEFQVEQRSKWWTMDRITKFIGPPTCRQIRVDREKCSLNLLGKNSSTGCIPNWGADVEDDDDYVPGWKIVTGFETVHEEESAWKYVLPSKSDRLSRQGASWTTYHGGGYMVSLGRGRIKTVDTIQVLKSSEWIDAFTRVVFLGFTLFNVNEDLFTEVVLIAEHFPFGFYLTRTLVNSVQLDMTRNVWNVGFILLIFIIAFHVVTMLKMMNRNGFMKYFSEYVNMYQFFVTSLGVLSIVFFVVHYKTSLDYTETFQRKGLEVFFEFDNIVYYSVISANNLTILFCCLMFRLFSLWPFGGNSFNIYHTLIVSGISIGRFLVLFFVHVFVSCRLISFLVNCMLPTSAFYWQWSKSVHEGSSTLESTVLFLLSFSVKLCLLYMLMLFRYQYRLGKGKKHQKTSDFVMIFEWLARKN